MSRRSGGTRWVHLGQYRVVPGLKLSKLTVMNIVKTMADMLRLRLDLMKKIEAAANSGGDATQLQAALIQNDAAILVEEKKFSENRSKVFSK
jgi:hypothetical protein